MVCKISPSDARVAVIGGGVIGLCIALKLQLEGKRVTLFERADAGEKCSKGNAGHFATEQVFPLASPSLLPQLPKMLLSTKSPVSIRFQDLHSTGGWMLRFLSKARKSPTEHATKALTELNSHAMKSWQSLLEQVGLSELIIHNGSLLSFESATLFKRYRPTLKALELQGVRYQIWQHEKLREQVPSLSNKVRVGVFFPDTSHSADPYKICLELKNSFLSLGGVWIKENVTDAYFESGFGVVVTQKNTYSTDFSVVACGAESVPLVKKITGVSIPLQAERGYHLMMPKLKGVLPFPVSSADRKFIMTPMDQGLRLAGTVEYAALNSPPNYKRANMLKGLAKKVLAHDVDLTEAGQVWMGNRPSLPDSLPIIDSDKSGRILFSLGHQHLGLTQAAVTSDLISQLINQQNPLVDISPFKLDRFC
ncbi:NAD(P)/FAD-dependent oxidoreductase [Vibrio splendidus]|uniref:NAD(P)/FAD-dependent oxidoreductase n=1 Tax=Vibrio splendidus TaxID=29497 RepID=UPI000C84684A|nr:FAD-dependent oxidoreductase [Vibrio splendidus]PMI74509.1 amino acid dehydrogenase [Vibrio splendidus]